MGEYCIFCGIIEGALPSREVYSDEWVYAFHDIRPVAPTHILIIPRKHIERISHIDPEEKELVGHMFHAANEIAARAGLSDDGFRYVFNCGPMGGQTVYHLHLHLLGGRPFTWPPG